MGKDCPKFEGELLSMGLMWILYAQVFIRDFILKRYEKPGKPSAITLSFILRLYSGIKHCKDVRSK